MRHIVMLSGLMGMFKIDFSSLFKAPRRKQPHVYSPGEKTKQKAEGEKAKRAEQKSYFLDFIEELEIIK